MTYFTPVFKDWLGHTTQEEPTRGLGPRAGRRLRQRPGMGRAPGPPRKPLESGSVPRPPGFDVHRQPLHFWPPLPTTAPGPRQVVNNKNSVNGLDDCKANGTGWGAVMKERHENRRESRSS